MDANERIDHLPHPSVLGLLLGVATRQVSRSICCGRPCRPQGHGSCLKSPHLAASEASWRSNAGVRYVQLHPAQKKMCGTCVVTFQPCTWTRTNPTPGVTLTLTLSRTPTLWGARGRQEQPRGPAACFGGVFPKKRRAAERPALTNKTRILHSVKGRIHLHTGRGQGFIW